MDTNLASITNSKLSKKYIFMIAIIIMLIALCTILFIHIKNTRSGSNNNLIIEINGEKFFQNTFTVYAKFARRNFQLPNVLESSISPIYDAEKNKHSDVIKTNAINNIIKDMVQLQEAQTNELSLNSDDIAKAKQSSKPENSNKIIYNETLEYYKNQLLISKLKFKKMNEFKESIKEQEIKNYYEKFKTSYYIEYSTKKYKDGFRIKPLSEVRDEIIKSLLEEKYNEYVKNLISKAKVIKHENLINELNLAKIA